MRVRPATTRCCRWFGPAPSGYLETRSELRGARLHITHASVSDWSFQMVYIFFNTTICSAVLAGQNMIVRATRGS